MHKHCVLLLLTMNILLCSVSAQGSFYDDISRAFLPPDINEIVVGDGTRPIIEIEANTPLPLGVAVILTDANASSLTLAQGQSLGYALADKGWNVIVSPLTLPTEQTPNHLNAANGVAETAEATLSNDSSNMSNGNKALHPRSNLLHQNLDFQGVTSELSLYLSALNNYLQPRQGYRLFIAQGMSATSYLSVMRAQPNLHPDSFIAISPFWPDTFINADIVRNIAESSYPILDISINGVSKWSSSTASERKQRSKNELKVHYRQVNIPLNPLSFSIIENKNHPYIQQITNHTIGWTRYLGW